MNQVIHRRLCPQVVCYILSHFFLVVCMHVRFEDIITHRLTVAAHSPNLLPVSLSTYFLLRSQRSSEKNVHTYMYNFFAFFTSLLALALLKKKIPWIWYGQRPRQLSCTRIRACSPAVHSSTKHEWDGQLRSVTCKEMHIYRGIVGCLLPM